MEQKERLESCKKYRKLLLHVPHASTSFPENSGYTSNDLDNEESLLIDYYTDELFVPKDESEHIHGIVFPYCRLYCDVERLINDPLENDGLGISYSRWVPSSSGQGQIYRSFSTKERAFRLYTDFHAQASKKIVELGSDLLLIDCHSFSSQPNLLCSNPSDIDICIGFNDDDTCPDKVVIGNIKHHFESLGYKVGINTPFSNSKTFEVPLKYHSVMIEVNKRLYMNEDTLEKTDGFEKIKNDIQSLYCQLLKKQSNSNNYYGKTTMNESSKSKEPSKAQQILERTYKLFTEAGYTVTEEGPNERFITIVFKKHRDTRHNDSGETGGLR